MQQIAHMVLCTIEECDWLQRKAVGEGGVEPL